MYVQYTRCSFCFNRFKTNSSKTAFHSDRLQNSRYFLPHNEGKKSLFLYLRTNIALWKAKRYFKPYGKRFLLTAILTSILAAESATS